MAGMKVSTRLAAGFGVVIVMLGLTASVGISRMAQMHERLQTVVNVNDAEKNQVMVMRATVFDRMIALRNIALLSDKTEMAAQVARIEEDEKRYAKADEALASMFAAHNSTPADQKAALQVAREQQKAAAPIMQRAVAAGLVNDNFLAGNLLIKDLRPIQNKWMDALAELANSQDKASHEAMMAADDSYKTASKLMMLLAIGAVIAAAIAGWLISRSLTRQLGAEPDYAALVADEIASGNLNAVIAVRDDDQGSLLLAMKKMRDELAGIVTRVRVGSEILATSAGQIAAGNADLSSRTEQQASSLEETASSMEELTTTVKQNADSARQANQLALEASRVAARGGDVVAQVVETMGEIDTSSRKIVDIISVIDGIAFQTNILALNAAVEAARAGEQGRGFAVVATEVRSLAQKSAAAAKEIKTLIGDSVDKVDVGSKLVQQAGVTMQEVVSSVQRVTDIMSEISATTSEQSSGIEQVNQAILQMDQVTQQNAALVEQAAAASQAMQQQTGGLMQDMSFFKTASKAAGIAAPALVAMKAVAVSKPKPLASRVSKTAEKPAEKVVEKPAVRKARSQALVAQPVAPTRLPNPMPASSKEENWEEF